MSQAKTAQSHTPTPAPGADCMNAHPLDPRSLTPWSIDQCDKIWYSGWAKPVAEALVPKLGSDAVIS